jgi:phytoene dehydrogenase-like protein
VKRAQAARARELASLQKYDAVVVGAGPNGLAAAITLARAGRSVLLVEANATIGGGVRSAELTLPGFVHDTCSAVHPLGLSSPFFQTLPLAEHGLEWVHPTLPLAHPFDDGTAAVLHRSLDTTVERLGPDGPSYRRLLGPLVEEWDALVGDFLAPARIPRHPVILARFGLRAIVSSRWLARMAFRGEHARGLFAGMAAHSIMPLERPVTSAFGLVLAAMGHVVGWPIPRGGSQRLADALASYFKSLGGEIVTEAPVSSPDDLPPARDVLFDVTPRQLVAIVGERLPASYRRRLLAYRYGPGSFKMDWALDGPIPWRSPECGQAGTVHLGATLDEIALSERAMWHGKHAERPYIILAQQSAFDATRAPAGKHTVWAYCHVPHGSTEDMAARIEAQIERFAPGFTDRILARHVMDPAALQRHNANYIGGDINGGVQDLLQQWTRPVARWNPYSTPVEGIHICSSSTPPGGGVHGMCGYFAAEAILHTR